MVVHTRSRRLFRAAKAVVLIWIGSIAGGIFGFLVQVILARSLSAADYGAFSSAFATVNLLAPLCGFGIGSLWLRIFAQYGPTAVEWIRPSYRFCGISTTLTLVALALWGSSKLNNSTETLLLLSLSPLLLWQLVIGLVSAKLQLEARYYLFTYWQVSQHFFRFLGVSIFSAAGIISLRAVSALYATLALVTFLFSFRHLRALLTADVSSSLSTRSTYEDSPPVRLRDVWNNAWPYGVAGVFYLIYFQSNIITINYIRGPLDAGIYNIAFTILSALYLFPSAIYQKFLLPTLHRWATHDQSKLIDVCKVGGFIMLIIGAAAGILLFSFRHQLINSIFGEKYLSVLPALSVLCACVPIRFYASAIGSTMATQSHMRAKVKYMGYTAATNVVLNVVLIQFYGLIGAALSTVLSELMLLLFYRYYLKAHVFASGEWENWKWNEFLQRRDIKNAQSKC